MGQPKKKKKKGFGFAAPSSRIPRLAAAAKAPPSASVSASLPADKALANSKVTASDLVPSSPILVSELQNSGSEVPSTEVSGPAVTDSVVEGPSSNTDSPVSPTTPNLQKAPVFEAPGSPATRSVSSPKLAHLIQRSALLEELGSPTTHVSGVPFVLIPDANIDEAKEEFKDYVFARFRGEIPHKGRIIGVVNAIWARSGPRIFVHKVGEGCFILKVPSQRTREILLSRPAWMIAGSPMFVAPWSSEFSQEEPQLTTAVIPVEMRGVPYLLFNKQSLSRLSTAIGKPVSLAPETERKENFEVAKLWVSVNLLEDLPSRIVTGFSNGREIDIAVSYPWLPEKCSHCDQFGHNDDRCPRLMSLGQQGSSKEKRAPNYAKRRSRSRPSKSKRSSGQHSSSPEVHDSDAQRSVSQQNVQQSDPPQDDTQEELQLASEPSEPSPASGTETLPLDKPESDSTLSGGRDALPIRTSRECSPASAPVFSLNRPFGYAASVTVFHEPSQAQDQVSDGQSEDPFFLVQNGKSSRKATKN